MIGFGETDKIHQLPVKVIPSSRGLTSAWMECVHSFINRFDWDADSFPLSDF